MDMNCIKLYNSYALSRNYRSDVWNWTEFSIFSVTIRSAHIIDDENHMCMVF